MRHFYYISKSTVMRLILAIIFIIFGNQASAIDVKKLFEAVRPSVVLIVAYDSNDQPSSIGSKFYFGDKFTLATNLHVIENASKIAIKLSSGETDFIDTVLGVDAERDLAILRTKVAGTPLLLSERLPDIGEDIIAIGNPSGLEGTVSTGIISGIRTEAGSQYFQITAPISPGSSGGPIISEKQEVLGVSTFYLDGAQSLNFAMPSAYLTKLYNNQTQTTLSTLQMKTEKELVPVKENVAIISPEWATFYTDNSRDFIFSIVNKSQYEISNIKLLIKFYPHFIEGDDLPIDFMATIVKEKIPSQLSKRVKRNIKNAYTSSSSYKWRYDFKILDYEINKSSSDGTLLNFD